MQSCTSSLLITMYNSCLQKKCQKVSEICKLAFIAQTPSDTFFFFFFGHRFDILLRVNGLV